MKKYSVLLILFVGLILCASLASASYDNQNQLIYASSGYSESATNSLRGMLLNASVDNTFVCGVKRLSGSTVTQVLACTRPDCSAGVIANGSINSISDDLNFTSGTLIDGCVNVTGIGTSIYILVNNYASNYTSKYNSIPGYPGTLINFRWMNSVYNGVLNAEPHDIGRLYTRNGTLVAPAPTIALNSPANNSISHISNNSFSFNVSSSNLGGSAFNTTEYIYFENGTLYQSIKTAANNATNTVTINSTGIYYLNATITNGTYVLNSSTYKITVYDLISGIISIPAISQNVTSYLNISWSNSSTTNNSVAISSYNVSLLNVDGSLNRTIGITATNNFSWSIYPLNLSLGEYRILLLTTDANGYIINTSNAFNITRNAQINITTYDSRSGAAIQNFSINITDLSRGYSEVYNTTSYKISIDTVRGDLYNIFFDASGYAYDNTNYTANASAYQSINYSLTKTNSVTVTIKNEITNAVLSGVNVSILISATSINFTQTNFTTTGSLFLSNLTPALYSLEFSAVNYSTRTYYVTITDRTTQFLTAPLLPNAQAIGTYIKDPGDQPISGALFTVQKLINSSWITIAQGTTDGVGYIQFDLQDGGIYQGIITADGYVTRTFPFVPYYVNQPYTFKLSENASKAFIGFNNFIGYSYAPTYTQLNQTNVTFSFSTVQLNSSYGSNSILWTAINCSGSWTNVSGSPSGSTVTQTIDFYGYMGEKICQFAFQVDGYDSYSFSETYVILGYTAPTNNSIINTGKQLQENNSPAWNAILALFVIFIITVAVRALSGGDPEAVTIGAMAGLLIVTFIGLVNMAMGILICFEIGMIFFNRGGA